MAHRFFAPDESLIATGTCDAHG